jgi:hypothetical protein
MPDLKFRSHDSVQYLIRQPVISRQVSFIETSTNLREEPSRSGLLAIRIIGDPDYWRSGLLAIRIIDYPDYWRSGLLAIRIIGDSDYWRFGKPASE